LCQLSDVSHVEVSYIGRSLLRKQLPSHIQTSYHVCEALQVGQRSVLELLLKRIASTAVFIQFEIGEAIGFRSDPTRSDLLKACLRARM